MTKILILGAGYAGVQVAKTLPKLHTKSKIEITMVNQHDYHQFMTQLHEPASGRYSFDTIRVPLNEVLNHQVNLINDVVQKINTQNKRVHLASGLVLGYDYLVLALGSEPEYYSIPGLKENSLSLRNIDAARMIRQHILSCLASYKVFPQNKKMLNFVVGGAGFTGIELIGELAEWLPTICPKFDVDYNQVKLICIEASKTVLPGFHPELIKETTKIVQNKGVQLLTEKAIKEVKDGCIYLSDGSTIETNTIIWTGGVKGHSIISQSKFTQTRGRAHIDEYLRSVNHNDVFIIGDNALSTAPSGNPLPPTAQIAIQQGKHCAYNIANTILGKELIPFVFNNQGTVASIGKGHAVGIIKNKYLTKGTTAKWLKEIINLRYLYSLGGIPLIIRKKIS